MKLDNIDSRQHHFHSVEINDSLSMEKTENREHREMESIAMATNKYIYIFEFRYNTPQLFTL